MTTTGTNPVAYGFPLLASSKGSTVFDQENTNMVDRETLSLNTPTPRPSRIYVANNLDNNISVIDPTTNTVIDTIPVGKGPYYIVLMPDHDRAYVNYCCGNNYIIEIDTATNTIIANITLPAGSILNGLAIKPDGTRLYVTDYRTNAVMVIDTAANRIIANIGVGIGPFQIAVNPAGTGAYVANGGSVPPGNTTSVINTASNKVTANITVGNSPWGVVVSPDGTKAYVTNSGSNNVSVIDTATNTVTATILVGAHPEGIAVT
jgi:YVTN family beta-propeller protein